MEKLSRVKKYEELRKSIETENVVGDPTRDEMGEEQQKVLEKFDSSILKKVNIKEDDSYTPVREKTNRSIAETSIVDDTFTNEYLDDFIREVREYNIKKGNRESEDTQIDILSQLNAVNRAKRAHYVEDIKEDDSSVNEDKKVLSKDAIAQEVANLLVNDDEEDHHTETLLDDDIYATTEMILEEDSTAAVELPVQKDTVSIVASDVETPARKILKPSYDSGNTDLYETGDFNAEEHIIHKKLMEETQQLRVQMDEYEEELTDLSDGVVKNNKILNFILCFLILVLLAIIGFIGYYIWKSGGL